MRQLNGVIELLGNPRFLDDPRFETRKLRSVNLALLYREMARLTPAFTTDELVAKCHAVDLPAQPVRDIADIMSDPHLRATGFFKRRRHPSEGNYFEMQPSVRFHDADTTPVDAAPNLDEHGETVRKFGFRD